MIRITTLAICFFTALAHAEYKEERSMSVASSGIQEFHIDAEAGKLEIKGRKGGSEIRVEAKIVVDGISSRKAKEYIEDRVVLDLSTQGSTATLRSYMNNDGGQRFLQVFASNPDGRIDLYITLPEGIDLKINDGSGNIKIDDCENSMDIEDGSGSIRIRNVRGDMEIDDGSGNIQLDDIMGNVIIDDGSGSLDLRSIEGDLEVDDGSGSMSIHDIRGSVEVDDGSGSIDISTVSENVVIIDQGSGGCRIRNVDGRIEGDT